MGENGGAEHNRNAKKAKKQREFDFSRYPKRRIALMFLYYGWEYEGLVQQADTSNTVERELEKALLKTRLIESWQSCEWSRSGRTDKGVSAFRQIASLIVRSNDVNGLHVFWPEDSVPESRIREGQDEMPYLKMLNATLPKNIRVLAWSPVPKDFSARFSCDKRVYKYAFLRANFDLEAIRNACRLLVGTHDFRNFCRIDMNLKRVEMSYLRSVYSADVSFVLESGEKIDCSSNRDCIESPFCLLEFTISASGFLWHQIRCIMALLYEIGMGNEKPEIISELLDVKETPRKPAYGLAPASPLCLFDCSYKDIELHWNWDIASLRDVQSQLLKTFADLQAKSAMLRNMAEEIGTMVSELKDDRSGLSEFLRPSGTACKVYVPIRKRPTCDALEEKQEKLRAKKAKIGEEATLYSNISRESTKESCLLIPENTAS